MENSKTLRASVKAIIIVNSIIAVIVLVFVAIDEGVIYSLIFSAIILLFGLPTIICFNAFMHVIADISDTNRQILESMKNKENTEKVD